jgi:hypothetical protein
MSRRPQRRYRMATRIPFISTVGLLVACGGPGDDSVDVRTLPIIGGKTDSGDPSVVAIWSGSGPLDSELCTGTVISPYAVLTAVHCLMDSAGLLRDPGDLAVVTGTTAWSPTALDVSERFPHPTHDIGIPSLRKTAVI